jgi:hypothetical protein
MARVVLGAVSLFVLVLLLLFAGLAPHARAGESPPICRAPSVIDVMTRELRRRDPYVRIERRLIAEYPGVAPNIVICGVLAQTLRYDASRNNGLPVRYSALYEFRVRAVLDGYVVQFER